MVSHPSNVNNANNNESSWYPSSRSTLRTVPHNTAAGLNEGPQNFHISPTRAGFIPIHSLTNNQVRPRPNISIGTPNTIIMGQAPSHIQGQDQGYPQGPPGSGRRSYHVDLQFGNPSPTTASTQGQGEARTPTTARVIHPPPQYWSTNNGTNNYQGTGQVADIVIHMPSPPPPADHLPSIGTITLSGFQTDYSRVIVGDDHLRRAPNSEEIRATVQMRDNEENKPVPAEAYIIMRPHREPNRGWNDGIAEEMRLADEWTYELQLIQQPTRGKALGLGPLPRGWPALSAPLIVQLIVKDQNGRVIPVDHPILNRKLVHTSMTVDLVSEDGKQSRSFMRVRPAVHDPSKPPSPTAHTPIDPEVFNRTQRNLLGSLHRSASTYVLDGKKGIYFLFTELVVRNVGRFALRVSLLDLAGPTHIGTSIGITKTISSALTHPFTVYHGTEFPGALPVTDLSMKFTRQGERNLGRRIRSDNNGLSSEDDMMVHASHSPEVEVEPRPQSQAGTQAQAQGQSNFAAGHVSNPVASSSPSQGQGRDYPTAGWTEQIIRVLPQGSYIRRVRPDPSRPPRQGEEGEERGNEGFERSHL
ncbi:hypothetical protein I302_104741 [Kwoniella bestiolae CBS 10118]|uniref:Velvet domain-containing protein n=1 Tax=Kwoniella bestiolae CBS 10118 TaxID=1296100 RepID=A0A1B9FRW6_9TREE|nr:hypothetical protein I302_09189 [Kwoniella bestiolae CBS 10118]OCF21510.1 hypothetical protein I302_09189 [Kwoniella bestiolae CBS 10118]